MESQEFPNEIVLVCLQPNQFVGYDNGKKAYESGNDTASMWDNAMLLAGQLVYGSNGGFTINSLLSTEYLYFYSLKHGDPVKREEKKQTGSRNFRW